MTSVTGFVSEKGGVASTAEAVNEFNADIESAGTLIDAGLEYESTIFLGAMGMMCREYGGWLKYSEGVVFNRVLRSSGTFDNYITEGDGLRQAAQNLTSVFDLKSANALKQAEQFGAVTDELLNRMESTK